MSITRYEAYKDSGVEWLGEVPAHWGLQRFKDFADILSGYSPEEVKPDLQGNMAYYKVDDLNSLSETSHITQSTWYVNSTKCVYKKNILLLPKRGMSILTNKVGITNINCIFDTNLMGLRLSSKYVDIKFIFYWTINVGLSKLADITTIPQLNNKHIYPIAIYLPTRKEQAAIANYLDTKTAQIDRKLDLLSQKATQYGKLKQSLINETVTRGLDKTVAMKDSGVEWIGEVPAHWILNRHKDNFSFVAGRCTNSSLTKVGLENIEGKTGRFISTDTQFDGDGVEFKKNDILFGKLRPYLAKVYLSEFNGNAVGDIFVYRPTRNTKPKFALYLMLSDKYIDVINSSTAGAKMPRVGSNFIANLPVSIPSKQEQQAIVVYLDDKTAHIDSIVATINTQIDKLKELRKALINDVVTGKICVLPESAQKL